MLLFKIMGLALAHDFQVEIKAAIVKQGKLLILTDETDEKPLYDVPGGRMESTEQLEETLVREVSEELPGSKNIIIKKYLFTNNPGIKLRNGSHLLLIYFLVDCDLPDPIRLSHEHTDYRWVDKSDLSELESQTSFRLPEGVKKLIRSVTK